MFLSRCLVAKTNIWRNYLLSDSLSSNVLSSIRNYSGIAAVSRESKCNCFKTNIGKSYTIEHRKQYSEGLINGDVTELLKNQYERDLKNISELFPQPRVTLYELTNKTPQKIFDVHYKQLTNTPKGKKKKIVQGDWVCSYTFIWPEKKKFESKALSKRQAAETAATMALHWLYINKHVNSKGHPMYDQKVLDNLRSNMNLPIEITISDKSVERIEKIWNEYESEIKPIYESTFQAALKKAVRPSALLRDSSLDNDDYSEDEADLGELDFADNKSQIHPVYSRSVQRPTTAILQRRDRQLEQAFERYDENIAPLPLDQYRDEIAKTLDKSRVAILVGAAGCGKSTRAPAAILRRCGANTTAIVSEPRRVAAIDLARTVARDLGEEVGETIGYQVRLQSKPPRPPAGSILYCTSGVLLRRLQANPGLEGCSHVIIDEAHERDVNTDITLLLLKRALTINDQLKVVVMSATLDIDVFTNYFKDCPVIEVPGRAFPVQLFHLDDIKRKYGLQLRKTVDNCMKEDGRPAVYCQEVVDLIKAVDKKEPEGAILVFLPGWADIKAANQLLRDHYGESSTHLILPVHSRLSTTDQSKMFAIPLPGVRKIVLATNIAETSITIPDVVYVIDTGVHKENRTKEGTGTASLETAWVSMAAAKQRAGRAGRVRPGHCYRLYSQERAAEFVPYLTPEILRVPLEQTVLDCKTYAPEDKVEDFLSQLPKPPSKRAIEFAVKDLIDLGALTPTERLTRLGGLLSAMTLPPRLGCCMLMAAAVGCALSTANVVTHCADNLELFVDAADRRDEIREIKRKYNATSDHAALHTIQDEFEHVNRQGRRASDAWCQTYGLRGDRLSYVRSLSNIHLEQLLKSGFLPPNPDPTELTRFSDIDEITAGVLLAGANSFLTTKRQVKTKGKLATVVELFTTKGERAHIGSESVNHAITKRTNSTQLLAYYGGQHSLERRALVVYKTSVVPPHSAVLFCRGNVHSEVTVWNDQKCRVRGKLVSINANQRATGGGPSNAPSLSALEDRIANILGRDVGPMPNISQDQLGEIIVEHVVEDEVQDNVHEVQNMSPPIVLNIEPEYPASVPPSPSLVGQVPTTPPGPVRRTGRERRRQIISRPLSQPIMTTRTALEESRSMILTIERIKAETAMHNAEAFKMMAESFKLISKSVDRLSRKSEDNMTTLNLPRHRLHVKLPSSQATQILKAREMLWNTFQYYLDRDLQTIDYDDHETLSKFNVNLVKTIGRVLVEGHRQYVLGENKDVDE